MSATRRPVRALVSDDFFATPAWVTRAIVPYLPAQLGGSVLDPCCGEGAILDVFTTAQRFGIELDAGRAQSARRVAHHVTHADALSVEWPDARMVVMNPPFSLAEEFVRKGIAWASERAEDAATPLLARANRRVCAVLLRLAWLESEKRIELHRAFPCDVYPLAYRPSFIANVKCIGSDGENDKGCGWHVSLPLDAPRPKRCPTCEGYTKTVTHDSCAYGWFIYGPGRGGRIQVLFDEPPNVRRKAKPRIVPGHIESVNTTVGFARPPEAMHGYCDQADGSDFPERVEVAT